MNVLLIGSGGREHAIGWALDRSPRLTRLRCAPGNPGLAGLSERTANVPLAADDVEGLARHAVDERYDLVVIGPEAPLVAGLADTLRAAGVACFGPGAAAARVEGSKVFAKEFMQRHGVPTAPFRVFDDAAAARDYLAGPEATYPLVVKADGLAAGKGVLMAGDAEAALRAAATILEQKAFGSAGSRIVVEQHLFGREASFFVLTDGSRYVDLATCQDYKRARDGDAGLNTGGMGTYSPSAYLDAATRRTILDRVVEPTIAGLAAEGCPYRGVLYVGVMLTADGPQVLEYNARFGDPETQVLMPRLDGDWLELLHACATGRLDPATVRWRDEAALCVVMTAGGYPEAYEKGRTIEGLERAASLAQVHVFHAGTTLDAAGRPTTAGGRVLGVTALGRDLAAARQRAYEAVNQIHWPGEHHRDDIGLDAVRALAQRTAE